MNDRHLQKIPQVPLLTFWQRLSLCFKHSASFLNTDKAFANNTGVDFSGDGDGGLRMELN